MFKFLHAADIHLDSPMHRLEAYEGAPIDELRQATRRAFENLITLALTEAVDFLLIAGDLFDGDWRDYNTGLYFVFQVNRLKEAGIPVFIVSGNHDAASKVTRSLRWPDNVFVFPSDNPTTRIIDSLHVAIHGQSFATPALKRNLAAAYPPPVDGHFNIGLLHTCLTGREGHEPYAPCKTDDLKEKGYDYWALGHVHQFERVLHDPMIVFSGCIQGRHIRETGAKGCALVNVDERSSPSLEFSPLDVIRWIKLNIDVSSVGGLFECLDLARSRMLSALEENGTRPLVIRIEFSGETKAHDALIGDPEHLLVELRSAAMDVDVLRIWIEKVKVRTRALEIGPRPDPVSGPIAEIGDFLDELESDHEALESLKQLMDDLRKKLPREYLKQAGEETLDNSEWYTNLLESAGKLLVNRLMKSEKST